MANITLPYLMENDRINSYKANSVHLDADLITLQDAVNTKISADGSDMMGGQLNMGGNRIIETASPVNNGDVANKLYVDNSIAAIQPATDSNLGLVQIGNNINVTNGTISIPEADIGTFGVVSLGSTSTTATAEVSAVRKSVVTTTIPVTGENGVIYFVYTI